MIPILFSPKTTDFSTNGVGRLSDAVSCVVAETLNGSFELEMQYPVTGAHFSEIMHSSIIYAKPSARRAPQAFRVYQITRPTNGIVTILADHLSYQMAFIPVAPFMAASLAEALTLIDQNAEEDNPFTLSADFSKSVAFSTTRPYSMREILGEEENSLLATYGGFWEFDNYTATLKEQRGEDSGYSIRYGKNLITAEQEENIAETYTGVFPYWQSENVLVILPEKTVDSVTVADYPFKRTIIHNFSDEFKNAPTAEQLRSAAEAYLAQPGVGIPKVCLSLEFVNLADTIEYRDLLTGSVDLGDTVEVVFEKLGINVKASVVSVHYNTLLERYESIDIGDRKQTLAETIEEQLARLEITPTVAEVKTSIDRATGVLDAGTRGHVVINRNPEGYANEILFLDTDSLSTAVNVLRINMNGIGFSSSGYQGPYYQAWTLDGHMSLGGVNNAYGHLSILDPNGNPIGQWSKDGIVVDQGTIDLLRRAGKIGLYVDGATVRIGDFEVNDRWGRQVIESDDEMTGMSGRPTEEGGLFFWAGYEDENTYMMAINENDVYIRGKDSSGNWHTYPLAATLARLGA